MLLRLNIPSEHGWKETGEDSISSNDRMMQAYAAWMALQSIPPEKRATLGMDLTGAPGLDNSRVIALPNSGAYANTERKGAEEEYNKSRTLSTLVSALNNISGKEMRNSYGSPQHTVDDLYQGKYPDMHSVLVVSTTDQRIQGESRSGKLVVESISPATSAATYSQQDGQNSHASQLRERTREIKVNYGRKDFSADRPVAEIIPDSAFVEYYTQPRLVSALKANQGEMMTASALAALPIGAAKAAK